MPGTAAAAARFASAFVQSAFRRPRRTKSTAEETIRVTYPPFSKQIPKYLSLFWHACLPSIADEKNRTKRRPLRPLYLNLSCVESALVIPQSSRVFLNLRFFHFSPVPSLGDLIFPLTPALLADLVCIPANTRSLPRGSSMSSSGSGRWNPRDSFRRKIN